MTRNINSILRNFWVRKIHWRRDRLPTPVFLGFLWGSAGKEFACNAGDLGLIPGLGRSPGEGKGFPLQYTGLENSMDSIARGVTNSRTRLSNFQFTSLHTLFMYKHIFYIVSPKTMWEIIKEIICLKIWKTTIILHGHSGIGLSVLSRSVAFDFLWPPTARFLCPWNFPGKNSGVSCHFLLQGICPIQGFNPCLLSLLH